MNSCSEGNSTDKFNLWLIYIFLLLWKKVSQIDLNGDFTAVIAIIKKSPGFLFCFGNLQEIWTTRVNSTWILIRICRWCAYLISRKLVSTLLLTAQTSYPIPFKWSMTFLVEKKPFDYSTTTRIACITLYLVFRREVVILYCGPSPARVGNWRSAAKKKWPLLALDVKFFEIYF